MGRKTSEAISYPNGPGGREVCNKNAAGRREYRHRVQVMHERQGGMCAICWRPLRLEQATFDHENGRGMSGGKRDDRIVIDGLPQNAAVHGLCNSERGSKRTAYLIPPSVGSSLHLEEMLEGD